MTQAWTNAPYDDEPTQTLSIMTPTTAPLQVSEPAPVLPPVSAPAPAPLSLADALREDWTDVRPPLGASSHDAAVTARGWLADIDHLLMAVTIFVGVLLLAVVNAFGH